MRSRFVRPETAILRLSRGDTLTVRQRLTAGEQRAAYARAYRARDGDREPQASLDEAWVALMTAYLLDWSLCDDDGRRVVIAGQPVETVIAALDALDIESFFEIRDAIQAHDAAMVAAREQEKNGQDGERPSPGISPSPAAAPGDTNGSETSTPMSMTSSSLT